MKLGFYGSISLTFEVRGASPLNEGCSFVKFENFRLLGSLTGNLKIIYGSTDM